MRKNVLSLILSASLICGLMPVDGTGQKASAASDNQTAVEQTNALVQGRSNEEGEVTESGSFGGTKDAVTGEVTQEDTHKWSYMSTTGVLTISGEGDMPNYVSTASADNCYKNAPWYKYAAEIKKVVFTGNVTSVGNYAFAKDYTLLTEVDITGAEKLTKMGENSFQSSKVSSILGMEQLITLGNSAFSELPLTEVNMPNVETISASSVFLGCTSLTKVNFPKLTAITGRSAFMKCTSLEEISMPVLTKIEGEDTFWNCSALRKLELPELERINAGAAFQNCGLETISLPKLKYIIMNSIFSGNSKLTHVELPALLRLGNFAFQECSQLVDVEIPECCYIGNGSFDQCYSLAELNVPKLGEKHVDDNGRDALGGFHNSSPFSECYSMAYIDLPSGIGKLVKSLPGMPNLQRVYYRNTEALYKGTYAANEFTGVTAKIYVPSTQVQQGFSNYTSGGGVEVVSDFSTLKKENKLRITCDSFDNTEKASPKVTANTANAGVTFEYYKDNACTQPVDASDATKAPEEPGEYFVRARSAETDEYFGTTSNIVGFTVYGEMEHDGWTLNNKTWCLTLTKDMENYNEDSAVPWYSEMEKITAVKVKEGVTLTKIGDWAFTGASNLESFDIPATVTSIGTRAFSSCSKWNSTVKLEGVSIGEYGLYGCRELSGTISFADNVTTIPGSCICDTKISEIILPDSVESIGNSAFAYNSELRKINIPDKVTQIPASFVQAAKKLTELTIPDGVTAIGSSAFLETGIKELKLPDGLQTIDDYAFSDMKDLQEIAIPTGVTIWSKGMLAGTGIHKMVIPNTVEQIKGGLFKRCTQLEYVEFEKTDYTSDTLSKHAFSYNVNGQSVDIDGFFTGCEKVWVVCDGTTYETLSGYQQLYDESIYKDEATFEQYKQYGWRGVLHKPEELGQILAATLSEAENLKEADYEADLWQDFQKTLADAKALGEQGETNYEKFVNQKTAEENIKKGVMTFLNNTYKKATEMVERDYDTDDDSWWDYLDALDNAKTMLYGETIPEVSDIVRVEATLKKAMSEAILLPTEDAVKVLDATVAEVKKLQEGDYTPETWKALQDAVKAGEEIKQTGTISQIEAANKKIEDAVKALVKVSDTSTTPSPNPGQDNPATPSPNPGQDNPTTPSPGQNVTPNPKDNGVKPSKKPKKKKVAVKKVSIKKVKSKKKKTLFVQWKKLSGVTGYQIQVSTNKRFKKGVKKYTVGKAKTTKKTIKKLKRKKKYYVRIRAYKKVSGKKYYGKFSKVKKAKVK